MAFHPLKWLQVWFVWCTGKADVTQFTIDCSPSQSSDQKRRSERIVYCRLGAIERAQSRANGLAKYTRNRSTRRKTFCHIVAQLSSCLPMRSGTNLVKLKGGSGPQQPQSPAKMHHGNQILAFVNGLRGWMMRLLNCLNGILLNYFVPVV
jgi:hypothetical protein